MRAQCMRRTLLSLVLGLLFLSTAAKGKCSGKYHELLRQLRHQADHMRDTSTLLDPYIRMQGLDTPGLKEHCKDRPGAFPSEGTLRGFSKRVFLQTLNTTLGLVLHRLTALQQDLPEAQHLARLNIRGLRSNIHCMYQLLLGSSEAETAEPTQPGPRATPPPTPPSDAFQHKLKGCRFLHGYHSFMHSVAQVLREWGESLGRSRSRRHSPHPALQKGARRMRPLRRDKRLMPRGQLPR
ncbi:oncostatin-M isoform X2 [Phacochoerus africanus]|uniref:oncostatin-M isoform X2 n=1 Tax=Phacochoerus africanus TaxID=41426 RepID=UPI001FD99977|nr:oncostatin-M isoform X2 [Phacochoerus africanus]